MQKLIITSQNLTIYLLRTNPREEWNNCADWILFFIWDFLQRLQFPFPTRLKITFLLLNSFTLPPSVPNHGTHVEGIKNWQLSTQTSVLLPVSHVLLPYVCKYYFHKKIKRNSPWHQKSSFWALWTTDMILRSPSTRPSCPWTTWLSKWRENPIQ